MAQTYELTKIRFPFDKKATWVLASANRDSSPFGEYRTKREAERDARRYGLKITRVTDQTTQD